MSIAMFGGGFFFEPFTQAASYGIFTLTNGAGPGIYGAWVEITPASIHGRWMQVDLANPSGPIGVHAVQLGRGPAGFEAFWIPSGPVGGLYAAMAAGVTHPPRSYVFPISLDLNTRLVARSAGAALETITLIVNVWG